MAFDTELMDSPKEFFKKGDVLKIEKKDWGGEFVPNLVVYLDYMLIGYVADDKDTPKEQMDIQSEHFEDHLLAEWTIGIKEEELDGFVKL